MSKNTQSSKKRCRTPATVRVELTLEDIEIVLKAFAHVIDGPLPESAWIDRLSLLKTLSDDARLAARSRLTQIVTLSSRDSISWVTQNPCDSAQR